MKLLLCVVASILPLAQVAAQEEYTVRYQVSDSRDGKSEIRVRKKGPVVCVESLRPNSIASMLALYTHKYTAIQQRQSDDLKTVELFKPGHTAIDNPPLLPFSSGPLTITQSNISDGKVRNVDAVTDEDPASYEQADIKLGADGRIGEVTQKWEGQPYQTTKYSSYKPLTPRFAVPGQIDKLRFDKGRERKTHYRLVSAVATCADRLTTDSLLSSGSVVSVYNKGGAPASFYLNNAKGDIQDQADQALSNGKGATHEGPNKGGFSPVVPLIVAVLVILAAIYAGQAFLSRRNR